MMRERAGATIRAAWIVGHGCRLSLAFIFLWAAALKSLDPEGFAAEVLQYGILSGVVAKLFAYAMLPLEMAVGLALLVNYRSVLSVGAASILLVMFIGAIGFAIVTHQPLTSCGCFGRNTPRTPAQTLQDDSIFLAVGLLGMGCLRLAGRVKAASGSGPAVARRWKPALLAGCMLFTGAFIMAAPRLPLDNLATALAPGVKWEDLGVALAEADLNSGAHFVALMGLKDEASIAALAGLNALAASGSVAVLGLYADDDAAYNEFFWNRGPAFPLYHSSPDDIGRLHRRLPRFFAVKDGAVTATWVTLPPASEISAALK